MHCILADLPPARMLPEPILLEIVSILEPEPTVNFASQATKRVKISTETYEWFKLKWPLEVFVACDNIMTFENVLNSISTNETSENIITYLTGLLSHPSIMCSELLIDRVTKIISTYCGSSTASDTLRLFKLSDEGDSIKIQEKGITNDLIGLKTWGASLPFSKRLIKDNSIFEKIKTDAFKQGVSNPNYVYNILELGSGTGLAGISILRKLSGCNNFKLFLTDLPEIVPNLEANIHLNNPNSECVSVLPLDWTDHTDFIAKVGDIKFDYIVVCDCLYSPEHPALVAKTVNQFLKEDTGELIMELPLRPRFEAERNNLWSFLAQFSFVKTKEEEDYGVDDFGESTYVFQSYIKK